ncbi:uncharacterized protein BDV14DRAFT_165213, partial [Aspergillus stella-maris]|uniref:uncharacterized protein n=1 Tax=Aspergillus stella-maris TaxID=1810926 RepID=UPI003CCD3EFD
MQLNSVFSALRVRPRRSLANAKSSRSDLSAPSPRPSFADNMLISTSSNRGLNVYGNSRKFHMLQV